MVGIRWDVDLWACGVGTRSGVHMCGAGRAARGVWRSRCARVGARVGATYLGGRIFMPSRPRSCMLRGFAEVTVSPEVTWHSHACCRRDIKPENVLFAGPSRTPKLADLGLAINMREERPNSNAGSEWGMCISRSSRGCAF